MSLCFGQFKKKFTDTNDNSIFYILKLFFSLHDNKFSTSVTSLYLFHCTVVAFCLNNGKLFFSELVLIFALVRIEQGLG